MDFGISAAEKLYEIIKTLLEMRDSAIGNVERCGHLFRRAEALKQTLEDEEVKMKLKIANSEPLCLTNLVAALKQTTAFIEKYGKKSKFGQFLNAFNIESDFNTLDGRFTSAVTDFHLFLGMQTFKVLTLSQSGSGSPLVKPVETRHKYDSDIIQALREDNTTSLVIRITPNIEAEQAVGLSLMEKLPGLWFMYCQTVEEFLDILKKYPMLYSITSRVRVISNRTLDNKTTGAQTLIETLKTFQRPFPTMVYCSEEGYNELRAWKAKDQGNRIWHSIYFTSCQNVFENFALMSRLLWVDHQDTPENRKMQLQIQEQGIEVVRAYSTQEAVNYIVQNPGVQNGDFRIITNRTRPEGPPNNVFWNSEAGMQFIDKARNELGIVSPALIFTAAQNVPGLQETIRRRNYQGVIVTAEESGVLAFCGASELTKVAKPREALVGIFSPSERNIPPVVMNPKAAIPIPASVPSQSTVGMLIFERIACKNLAAKDMGGTSDPYVVIKSNRANVKTMTIMKTLNPIWDTRYSLRSTNSDLITFDVWDWDLTSDDFEGRATLKLDAIPANVTLKKSLPLQSRPGKQDRVSGTIEISFRWTPDR